MLAFIASMPWWSWIFVVLVLVALRDVLLQRKHTISHNFPIVGHIRYMLENIGPELRQYLVANNREELPFNRIERSWVYASAKNQNNYKGFGTDRDIFSQNYVFVNNSMLPYKMAADHPNQTQKDFIPCAKIMGEYHKRKKPYRPASIINISAMSFGSLSAKAIESLNIGAKKAGAYHNTGEGGLSPYHKNGADVVLQIGTAYFGIREEDGSFSMEKLKKLVADNPCIKAIEIKLSQGAKPGKGGVLPAKKITKEISEIRHIPMNQDVISPPYHATFDNVRGMVDFIESIAKETGLPVGIKAAIGKVENWKELVVIMQQTNKGPDFITIDGGEGGTGAAPPSFADHVSLPFIYAFSEVYRLFKENDIANRVVFIASGKLGFPAQAAKAFAMGADIINVAREAMMSIGCIQAQVCHTNRCPAGVATQNKWLQSGIDVPLKSDRLAQYFGKFRKEFLEITHACGYEHPCQFTMDDVEMNLGDKNLTQTLAAIYKYHKTKVPFEGVEKLRTCKYLGGKN